VSALNITSKKTFSVPYHQYIIGRVSNGPAFFIALPKKTIPEPKTGVPVRLLEIIRFDIRHKYLIVYYTV
jgi:hypothetical protein